MATETNLNGHQFSRFEGESDEEVVYRICGQKDLIGSWQGVADILNEILGTEYTESKFRKQYQAFQRMFEANQSKLLGNDTYSESIQKEKQELFKERQKVRDERMELSRILRETSRFDDICSRLKESVSEIAHDRYVPYEPSREQPGENDLIVCLGDLHIGEETWNISGVYDSSIAKERLKEYLDKVIQIGERYQAKDCYLFLLGDLINGNIHKVISVTNRENVVEQIKLACEYIADFSYELGKHFQQVHVHSVGGNHSRLDTWQDSLTGERLDSLIPWFLRTALKGNPNIIVEEEEVDETMCSEVIRGRVYVAVHGDYDASSVSGIQKLSAWCGYKPYCVLMGHNHYPSCSRPDGTWIVQSGSLCGSGDEYARKRRLCGNPSQTVLVVSDAGIESCCPVSFSM